MKILAERFLDEEQAKTFWENSVFDMLDICFYLSDCGLPKCGHEFCELFSDKPFMAVVVNYKFNFELIKKFLGVPNVYINRDVDFENFTDENRDKSLCVGDKSIEQKYLDVMSVLHRELEVAKKEVLGIN